MKLDDIQSKRLLARAVASSVFACLIRAQEEPEREAYWRRHADKLEAKFITQHGRHYSYFTQ